MFNNKVRLIFGGSFNPVHRGHVSTADAAVKYCASIGLTAKVIFSPVGDCYGKDGLISFSHRYQMLKLALGDTDFRVNNYEDRECCTSTLCLLEHHANENPEEGIMFLCGSDLVKSFTDECKLIGDKRVGDHGNAFG